MLLNTFLLELTGLSFLMPWDLDFDERSSYDNASPLLSVKVRMMLENAGNFLQCQRQTCLLGNTS